ncbi:TPA: uracil-DNA glycosylase [Candidatus Saccharibacteria bacterium]|nr:uracil-DNA glycosylase [Candidatus Saccharibacteria bacterium]HIO87741.1 uracil-DNA glycosylase [Candidatus Saccharibacteria bacterium]
MSKQSQISQLTQQIKYNEVCKKLADQATQLVMGEGNLDADLVFIGEAPGKKEDELGRPFVGASGKFLDEMLSSINLKREDVYITNIVKYRPPNNRDPLPQEKHEFRRYLDQQLAIIKPKLIVTLGRHSGMEFLPSLKISRDHGHAMRVSTESRLLSSELGDKDGKISILPLYHPAAALYNGSQRQTLLDDFSKIPQILELINEQQ